MSKSLADLRASRPQSRDERPLTVCLAPHLVAEVQALTEELNSLTVAALTASGDKSGPPRRLVEPEDPRVAEIHEEIAALLAEIGEHEGEVRVRANKTDGEWRRWCNEHPPRKESEPGFDRDVAVAGGFCNADDLIDDLGSYVHSWNGDKFEGSDWVDVFEPAVGLPDKAEMASAVVAMYEVRRDFPLYRQAMSVSLKRLKDSGSPEASGSPIAASTAGSPEPSKSATTEKVNESH